MNNKVALWRSTPPILFPISLGLLGLGLGWRNASQVIGFGPLIGNLLLGLAVSYCLFFLACYVRKLVARPGVLLEEISVPMARAGVSAAAMSLMLLAAVVLPSGGIAHWFWWAGVVTQIGASVLGGYAIWRDPPEKRQFSTFQYLTFVGLVVGPIAGVPLGYTAISLGMAWVSLIAWGVITIGIIRQLRRERPPVPLRPSMAIFLAPLCLLGVSFGLLGYNTVFTLLYWISMVVAAALIASVRWMVQGGWGAGWAAFTFPAAAFLQLQVLAAAKYGSGVSVLAVNVALVIVSPIILIIAFRVVKMWSAGVLAQKTGAACA